VRCTVMYGLVEISGGAFIIVMTLLLAVGIGAHGFLALIRGCVRAYRKVTRRSMGMAVFEDRLWRMPIRVSVKDGTCRTYDRDDNLVTSASLPSECGFLSCSPPALMCGFMFMAQPTASDALSCHIVRYDLDMRHSTNVTTVILCPEDTVHHVRLYYIAPRFLVVVGTRTMLTYCLAVASLTPSPPKKNVRPDLVFEATVPYVYHFPQQIPADATCVWQNCLLRIGVLPSYLEAFAHGPRKLPLYIADVTRFHVCDDDLLLLVYRGELYGLRSVKELIEHDSSIQIAPPTWITADGLGFYLRDRNKRSHGVSRATIDFLEREKCQLGETTATIKIKNVEDDGSDTNARFYRQRIGANTPFFLQQRQHHIYRACCHILLIDLCILVDTYLCGTFLETRNDIPDDLSLK
jgi:hypothetical protein